MKKLLSILLIVGFLAGGVFLGYATQPAQYKVNVGDAQWHTKLNAGLDALWGGITSLSTTVSNWVGIQSYQTATYIGASSFSVVGDLTSKYYSGQLLLLNQGVGGLVANIVVSSSYGGGITTVIVTTANLVATLAQSQILNPTSPDVLSIAVQNQIQSQYFTSPVGVTAGTGNAITATFVDSITALVDKLRVTVIASAANSSTTPTFAPNGLTAKTIVKGSNKALLTKDIPGPNYPMNLEYNVSLDKWVLLNPANSVSIPLIGNYMIRCMGDSITYGYPPGLEDALQTNLALYLPTPQWTIENKGISANTTTQMLARFNTDIIVPGNTDFVIINGGINDIVADASAATIESNLQAMYTMANNAGIKVIAVLVTPIKGHALWSAGRQVVLDAVNTWIWNTAINIDYKIDAYSTLEDPGTPDTLLPAYSSDWIHLTAMGYQVLGGVIFNGATGLHSAATIATESIRLFNMTAGNGILANYLQYHNFSLTRQDTIGAGDLSISSYGGIGFTGGKTSAPEGGAGFQVYLSPGGNLGVGTNVPDVGCKLDIWGKGATNATIGLGVRNSAGANNMYVRDDGYGWLNAAAWIYVSDVRLKEKIVALDKGLDSIMKLRPVNFDYIKGTKNQTGFIAQEIQKVLPDLVSEDLDGFLGVSTTSIIPYLVKALQEQQVQIDDLRARINKLEGVSNP